MNLKLKTRLTPINIAKNLNFIVNDATIKKYSSAASTITDIKNLVKNKCVSAHPIFDIEELNTFLSNCGAEHLVVLDKENDKNYYPKKKSSAKIFSYRKIASQGVLSKKNYKYVAVVGGCFNGVHKGHREMLKSVLEKMKNISDDNFILVILVESVKNTAKKELLKPEGRTKKYIQSTYSRAYVVSKLPGVNIVITLPPFFTEYYNLLIKIKTTHVFVRAGDAKTLAYCEAHKEKASKETEPLNISILTYEASIDASRIQTNSKKYGINSEKIKYSSRNFFDLDPTEKDS